MGWSVTAIAFPFTLTIRLIGWISQLPTLLVNFNANAVIILLGLISVVAVSEYVFAHKNIKRIATVVFAIALVFMMTTSFRIWGSNDLYVYCFSDKYDCQYILVDNAFGGEYLIINNKTSDDSISSVKTAMSENKFAKVDGIIIVGDVDGYYLSKLLMATNCPYVYGAENLSGTADGIYAGDSVLESGLTIGYSNSQTMDLVSGGKTLRVLAGDIYESGENSDIIVTYSVVDFDANGKYVVCDAGFDKSVKNCVPSTFTFELNNDRIKVESSWRY